ncbi:helicase associated domain-containing protein [Streptomyces sp. NPDC002521]
MAETYKTGHRATVAELGALSGDARPLVDDVALNTQAFDRLAQETVGLLTERHQAFLRTVEGDASRRNEAASQWPAAWWRLVARDAVAPEVGAVAAALVDPALRLLVTDERPLVRRSRHHGRFVTTLGDRLERGWLKEVERPKRPSARQAWMRGVARELRSPSLSASAHSGMWRVQAAHQPAEVGAGLRLLAATLPVDVRRHAGVAGWRAELWVPRRVGRGTGLKAVSTKRFWEGRGHARRHVARHGHLAVPHAGTPQEGFGLGRWLTNMRAASAGLPPEYVQVLVELESALADQLTAGLAAGPCSRSHPPPRQRW